MDATSLRLVRHFTRRLSTASIPRCDWWRLFAVQLGSRMGRLPSMDLADARLDERRELTELGCKPPRQFSQIPR